MFLVCVLDGSHWFVLDRTDSLEEADVLKAQYRLEHREAEILFRGGDGYYLIQTDGSCLKLSAP